jgi:hypothetical protein
MDTAKENRAISAETAIANFGRTRRLRVIVLSGVNYKDRFIESNFFSFSPQNRT